MAKVQHIDPAQKLIAIKDLVKKSSYERKPVNVKWVASNKAKLINEIRGLSPKDSLDILVFEALRGATASDIEVQSELSTHPIAKAIATRLAESIA